MSATIVSKPRLRTLPLARYGLVLLMLVAVRAPGAPAFVLDKPAFFADPQIARSLMGATYAYMPLANDAPRRLMVTTMAAAEIRSQLGELSEIQCANLFLDELRLTHERFFAVAMARPLAVGAAEFTQFRWSGEKDGKTLTGVLSCGVMGGNYFVIHFSDDVLAATHSFPVIRASLKTLRPQPH